LKSVVRNAGLSVDDLFEREDLVARACQAQILASLARTRPEVIAPSNSNSLPINGSEARAEIEKIRLLWEQTTRANEMSTRHETEGRCGIRVHQPLEQRCHSLHSFTCDMCQRQFGSQISLQQHRAASHFECYQCNRSFSSENALLQHTAAVHSRDNKGTKKGSHSTSPATTMAKKKRNTRRNVATPVTSTTTTTVTTTTVVHGSK